MAKAAEHEMIAGLLAGSDSDARQVEGWLSQVLTYHGWGQRIDPDDVRQRTWVALLSGLRHGKRPDGPLKPYVQGICKKLCLLSLRHSYGRPTVPLDRVEDPQAEQTPESELLDAERYREFLKIFSSLKYDCKRLLVWRFIKNLSSDQISEKLGIAAGAARKRLHTCLKEARGLAGQGVF